MLLETFSLNIFAVVNAVLKTWKDARIGQGLRVTKWNGIFGIFLKKPNSLKQNWIKSSIVLFNLF